MKSSKNRWLSLCLTACALTVSVAGGVYAQDGATPPDPAATATPAATGTAGQPDASSSALINPATPPASALPGITPGPLDQARKILLDRIQLAKSEGIGTANYMMAFNAIEDSVKAGQTAEQLRPRVESLARALHDQLEKGKILKTQRPVPPTSSQSLPSPDSAPSPGSGGSGPDLNKIKDALKNGGTGGLPPGLLDKLKDKFGGQIPSNIPEGIKDKIPKDILDKLNQ